MTYRDPDPLRWQTPPPGKNRKLVMGGFSHTRFEQCSEPVGKHRMTEVITLPLIAAMRLKEGKLLACFHPFRHHPLLETVAHGDDCADNGRIIGIGGDIAYERLVDLQSVDGKSTEVTQTRVSGAKVVDREPYSHGVESLQHSGGRLDIAHQNGFGQCEFEIVRLQVSFPENGANGFKEPLAAELHCRDVDRHLIELQASVDPGSRLSARLAKHPLADWHDKSAIFCDGDELVREDQSTLRMPPADERLGAGYRAGLEIDLRLIVEHEFVPFQGAAQVPFH